MSNDSRPPSAADTALKEGEKSSTTTVRPTEVSTSDEAKKGVPATSPSPPVIESKKPMPKISSRALRAGGAVRPSPNVTGTQLITRAPPRPGATTADRYLVIGEGVTAPFMALCLRMNGLECDLLQTQYHHDQDKGTIVLTPAMTQVLGDILGLSVPSGSVVGRVLTFDHVGNDMCDLDLNEFRDKGESPTFYSCDRLKVQQSLTSLCRMSQYACTMVPQGSIVDHRTLEALPNGNVALRYLHNPGISWEYKKIIVCSRDPDAVPEHALTADEMRQRSDNSMTRKEGKGNRWLEVNVPPLPPLGQYEKRFTPGSQEIVEIVTPRAVKMSVRPVLMATKLFYNVLMTLPDQVGDPRKSSYNAVHFWQEVTEKWTAGVPGYISHTMFKPMIEHIQNHASPKDFLVYKTPVYNVPHWVEMGGRILRIGHAAYSTQTDAVDVTEGLAFHDCFKTAEMLATNFEAVPKWLQEKRRLEVMEAMDQHAVLLKYALLERGQFRYATSRFGMKFLRRYKSNWRKVLLGLKTMV